MNNLNIVVADGAIVWAHEEFDCVITWNGSSIFNWWTLNANGWENVDIQTVYGITNVFEARGAAQAWAEAAEAEDF